MPKPAGYGFSDTSDLKYRQSKSTDVTAQVKTKLGLK